MPQHPAVLLESPVNELDHVRGPSRAPVTLVEYGDFECHYCGRAYGVLKELLRRFPEDLRLVFRHTPRPHAHPNAQLAAEASEAAAAQGKFWEMHDWMFEHQDALTEPSLVAHAGELGLDVTRFAEELRAHTYAARVNEHATSGAHTVLATPTLFLDGVRFDDTPDLATLEAAIEAARRVGEGGMRVAHSETAGGLFKQNVTVGPHSITADQPASAGGTEAGMNPHDLLAAALATCSAMTLQYAAKRRGFPLTRVEVDVRQAKVNGAHEMHRTIVLVGDLSDAQRATLMAIVARCPVAVTLSGKIVISSELRGGPESSG
jgi:uncharacterized OsmC-like protein